jgi:NAD(P)-dependent dehydrogenase (short-subunit alcohol dehydrogenase family)
MRVKELARKTVFVTGAASGIGLGIATAFMADASNRRLANLHDVMAFRHFTQFQS